ncbi:hypothetical protein [Sphingopyxis sp. Geo48]|uniref:hypothetical protein n=1 Tax=Sphingopyxis sp. Geo48 TaxID=545241 RepID=UPI0024B850F3|nr:hypothetical protein [Sphingopyxis sp. Geo48]
MNVATKLSPRDAAKEILWNRNDGLSWKAAQFLGQVVGLPDRPLSPAQSDWLKTLTERAGIGAEVDA